MGKLLICYPKVEHKLSQTAFENFTQQYNADKDLKDKLRDTHFTLFCNVLSLYSKSIYNRNKILRESKDLLAMDPDNAPSLRTNNKELGDKIQGVCKGTIWRRLSRLIEAGIIQKEWHGTTNNYELFINPNFLLISDVNNVNYVPESEYLPKKAIIENQKITKVKTTSLDDLQLITRKEPYNNVIINNGIVNDNFITKKNTLKSNPVKYSTKKGLNTEQKNDIIKIDVKKELSATEILAKKEKEFENYKYTMAKWVYAYMEHFLFSHKDVIFNAVKIKTISYIQKNYLKNVKTKTELEKRCNYLKLMIDHITEKYVKNNYQIEQFPLKYIDIDNTKSGFINVHYWLQDTAKFKKQLEIDKNNRDKLNKIIREYQNYKSVPAYSKAEEYVKKNIPNLLTEFYMFYNSNTQNLFKHFKKKTA